MANYQIAIQSGPQSLAQNTIYAMPGKSKWILSTDVLAVAATVGGTFSNFASSTTSGVLVPGGSFVKCTSSTCSIVVTNQ